VASSIGETAKLVASLELKDHFSGPAKKAAASLGKLESKAFRAGQQIGKGLQNAAHNVRNIGLVAAAGITLAVKQGLSSLAELETATTSVQGAITQMGQAGQVSAAQVATWANEIETSVQAAFDDKAITAAASTLIRFGKVAPQNLRQSLVVMTDLAAKTGDVDSAATLLARALADPAKAAGKLARQGIILTKSQEKTIKAMVKAGKTAEAQEFLLSELAKTTSGAATASVGEYGDALNMLEDASEDAKKALAVGFFPIIKKVSNLLSTELAKPATLNAIRSFGQDLADAFDSVLEIGRKLPWGTIGDSLKIAGAGAKAVLSAFTSLPPWVQTAVLTGWGLNKLTGGVLSDVIGGLASGLIKGVLGMNAGIVNINAAVVNGPGGIPGVPGAKTPGGPGSVIGNAAKVILPVAIASIAVGAAGALADAIDPSARAPGTTPLGQRDPRRFSKDGQVIQNSIKDLSSKVGDTSTTQGEKTRAAFNAQSAQQKAAIAAAANKSTTDAERIKGQVQIGASTTSAATMASAGMIVGAINSLDLSVDVTTVNRVTVKQTNYGPTGGSRNTGKAAEGFGGQ
jgi:hypothetical protein